MAKINEMYFNVCLLISSVLVATGAGSVLKPRPQSESRIVGGFKIDIKDVPWQVSLQLEGNHYCGGSIIGAKWILTAAHCTTGDNDNSDTITIKSGATAHRNGTTTKVKRIFAHPMHDMSTIDYDFALLELEDELQFGESREAIKLAESKDFYIDGSMALVTGWGITQNWNESCRILRGAGVQIIAQDKCVKMYEHEGVITDRMICAGFEQGGIDACQEDSGGPLVLYPNDRTREAKLIGVVSFGSGCAEVGFPGVYARVQAVRGWITEVTGI